MNNKNLKIDPRKLALINEVQKMAKGKSMDEGSSTCYGSQPEM